MKGYVIGEIDISDPSVFEEYRKKVPATIEKYGGKYIVRGGKTESLEGGWNPKRLVVLEFPSFEKAREWYHCPDYAPMIKLRQKGSKGRLVLVEGL